jgi:DNA-directed RNA polymerase subunit omega
MQKHVEVDEPEPTDMPLLTSTVPGSVGEQTAGADDVVEFEQMTEEELLRGLEGMPPAESPGSQRNGY